MLVDETSAYPCPGAAAPSTSSSNGPNSACGSRPAAASPRREWPPQDATPQSRRRRPLGGLGPHTLGALLLLVLHALLLRSPGAAAIQLDVDPSTTRVSRVGEWASKKMRYGHTHKPRSDSIHLPLPHPHSHRAQCLMDEYAPEEDSALKIRAVGRVQDGVRATVRLLCRSA